jgi:hypothetical protein
MHRAAAEGQSKEPGARIMKDQITALMEALRLSQAEIEKLKRKRQSVQTTVAAIEAILADPVVARAIENVEPMTASPGIVPEVPVRVRQDA